MIKILLKDKANSVADIIMFKTNVKSIKLRKTAYVFERYIANSMEKLPMKELKKLNINKIITKVIKPPAAFLISEGLNVM